MNSCLRIGLCLCLTLGLAFLTGCESKVTKENFDQIKVGMTQGQVESLLGGAGKDDTASGGYVAGNTGLSASKGPTDKTFIWDSESGGRIQVVFAEGKVVSKSQNGLE